jgi:hypothetical protein
MPLVGAVPTVEPADAAVVVRGRALVQAVVADLLRISL